MSLPYDEEIFRRDQFGGFVLSQRFKHICYRFRGTLKAVGQIISTNFILRALPRSISFDLFFCFIFFLFVLCYLILSEWVDKKNCKYTDCDMIDAINSPRKGLEWIGHEGVVFIIIYTFITNTVKVILEGKMSLIVSFLFGLLTYTIIFSFARYLLKRPSKGKFKRPLIESCLTAQSRVEKAGGAKI